MEILQIQERFHLVRDGALVLDVGCHPGGWAQVAVELAGETGRVVGVDLQPCAPVEGAVLLTGDITEPMTQERILAELGGQQLNVIVSDISPDITGKWDMDQSVAMTLVADVFDFALPLLVKGGGFTTKLFQGIGVDLNESSNSSSTPRKRKRQKQRQRQRKRKSKRKRKEKEKEK